MSFVAECDQCGVIERGDFEDVGDAAESHEQFHDVSITRVATDGGNSVDGTEKKNDGEKLIEGLREMVEDSTPDDEYWCPNCEENSVTDVLQTVQRPEFGKENELWGCTGCEYCFLPATQWRPIDTGTDRTGEPMTDGGTEFYVVDEAKPALVGGPHPSRVDAKQDDAIDDPDTIIMSERALEVVRSERPLRDEREDVDVIADGGRVRWDARLDGSELRDLAAKQWGQRAQINKAAEECSELAAALNRRLNGQQDPADLLTEFVDARIMLWQLELLWTDAELEVELDRLLRALAQRLGVADDTLATDGGAPVGPDPSRAHHPQTTPEADPQAHTEAHLGPHLHLCDLCGQEFDELTDLADHECRPVRADGGQLPDSIDELSREARRRDELPCRGCGEHVDRRHLDDRLCPGCRHGGDSDA